MSIFKKGEKDVPGCERTLFADYRFLFDKIRKQL